MGGLFVVVVPSENGIKTILMKCLLELGGVPTILPKTTTIPSFFYLPIFTNFRLTFYQKEKWFMIYQSVIWNFKNSACLVKDSVCSLHYFYNHKLLIILILRQMNVGKDTIAHFLFHILLHCALINYLVVLYSLFTFG